MKKVQKEVLLMSLQDVKRRLGPFTRPGNMEPFRVCDAELARLLAVVVNVLEVVVRDLEGTEEPPARPEGSGDPWRLGKLA